MILKSDPAGVQPPQRSHSDPVELTARAHDDLSDMPPMPAAIRSGSFDPDDPSGYWRVEGERWIARKVREGNTLQSVNWDLLRRNDDFGRRILSERVVHSLKLVAAYWSPRVCAGDVHGRIYSAGLVLLQHLQASPILRPVGGAPFQWEHLNEALVESLEQSARLSGKLRMLNTVNALRQWYGLMAAWPEGTSIAGASVELAQWWEGRTTKAGRGASRAQSADPIYGPLTLREIDSLRLKCETGIGALTDRIVVWLLIVTLSRDIELRRLRRKHFKADILPATTVDGAPTIRYHLYKPQAKTGRQPRARDARRLDDSARGQRPDDTRFELPQMLGRMLEEVLAPSFISPRLGVGGTRGGHTPLPGDDAPLLYWLQGGPNQLKTTLDRFVRVEAITTDRVLDEQGNPTLLVLDNYRFRHGVAGVHQQLGASDHELQRLLGHASVWTARENYGSERAADAMVMERAAGDFIAPLVHIMMTGQVEDPAAPRDLPLIPGAVPHLQRGRALKVIGNIGKCANLACDKNPVVSCFGCFSYVGGPAYLDEIGELRAEVVGFLAAPEANDQSPHFVAQLRATLAGIDVWIAFLTRARDSAAEPAPQVVTIGVGGGGGPPPATLRLPPPLPLSVTDSSSTSACRQAALAALIEEARSVLSSAEGQARFPGALWNDQTWVVLSEDHAPTHVCFVGEMIRGGGQARARRLREKGVPTWPESFADPVRAYLLVASGHTYWTTRRLLRSTCRFWQFLIASGRHSDGGPWTWNLLDDATLEAFSAHLLAGKSERVKAGRDWEAKSDVQTVRSVGWFLYEHGGCSPVTYTPLRAERETREAAARAALILPAEATGLKAGDIDPRSVEATTELVRAAERRWYEDANVRARWEPAQWSDNVWTLRGDDPTSQTSVVLWSADFVPKHLPRTPEVIRAYGVTSFPSSYANPLRALLLDRPDLTPASVATYFGLWRRFYRFLCDTRLSTLVAPWHWSMITDAQLLAFGAYLRAGLGRAEGESAGLKRGDATAAVMELRRVCDWLALRGAAPAVTVTRVGRELRTQEPGRVMEQRGRTATQSKRKAPATENSPLRVSRTESVPSAVFPPRIARMIEKGSARLATAALRERYPGAAWEDVAWQAVGRGDQVTLVFGQRKRRSDALSVLTPESDAVQAWPAWYGDPIRAMLTEQTSVGVGRLETIIGFLRSFWRFLVASKTHTPEKPWSWTRLDDRVLERYEMHLRDGREGHGKALLDTSIRAMMDAVIAFGRWLASHRVVRTPSYVPVAASSEARWRDEDEQRKAGATLLPPHRSLESLAMLYYDVTEGSLRGKLSPVNEACVLILVLLMMTGRRIGELVRLRHDCLLYETVRPWRDGWAATEGVRSTTRPEVAPDQRIVLRMRYWMEKKRAEREGVVGIMPTAAAVVEACIERLSKLSAAPRERALELEKTPDHFPLPAELASKAFLSSRDILTVVPSRQQLTEGGHGRVPTILKRAGLRSARILRSGACYYPADLAAAMQVARRRICPQDVVVRPVSGEPQMLSDTLLVTYYREGVKGAVPVPALVQRLSSARIAMRIGDARSPLWREVRRHAPELEIKGLRSHGFRRWLNSVGLHGGAPIAVLTRYFGRDHDEQTRAYIYPADMLDLPSQALTQDAKARAQHLKQEIKAGRVFASVALGYFQVRAAKGEEEANAYLDRNLPVAHPTEVGHCSRDLALAPCDKHLNCLDSCEHYVGTKGDPREVRALTDLAERLAQEGDMLRSQLAAGARIHVDRLPRSDRQLDEVRRILRWHHDPAIPDGTTITKDGPATRRLRVLT